MSEAWGTPEKRDRLKNVLCAVIDEEVLEDLEIVTIIQICLDACKRKQAEMDEDILKTLLEGGDKEC